LFWVFWKIGPFARISLVHFKISDGANRSCPVGHPSIVASNWFMSFWGGRRLLSHDYWHFRIGALPLRAKILDWEGKVDGLDLWHTRVSLMMQTLRNISGGFCRDGKTVPVSAPNVVLSFSGFATFSGWAMISAFWWDQYQDGTKILQSVRWGFRAIFISKERAHPTFGLFWTAAAHPERSGEERDLRWGIYDDQCCKLLKWSGKNLGYLLSFFRKPKKNKQEHNPSDVENKSDGKIRFKLQILA
jgi:hypothetical protein